MKKNCLSVIKTDGWALSAGNCWADNFAPVSFVAAGGNPAQHVVRFESRIFALILDYIGTGSIKPQKLTLQAVRRDQVADLDPNLATHDAFRLGAFVRSRFVIKTDRMAQTL